MRIGVDFDNTIVCYDRIFHQVALEQKLIPAELPASKELVRNHLRQNGHEELWIAMQGAVYGPRLLEADPFPGVLEFFAMCKKLGISVRIISHRTKHPFRGPQHDLHQAARDWLKARDHLGLSPSQIHFELTKPEKIARIRSEACTHFIDDLPEFLKEPGFPSDVAKILFDPNLNHDSYTDIARVSSWEEIAQTLLKPAPLPAPRPVLAALLKNAGLDGEFSIKSLPGAANNQVYRLDLGGKSAVLKAYFHHKDDTRDRLGAEYSFSKFAWDNGIKTCAQPLAQDAKRRLGLYEFVSGRRPSPADITADAVAQALEFFLALNRFKSKPAAKALPKASDSCFSFAEHVLCVERRIKTLKGLKTSLAASAEAVEFISGELSDAWKEALSLARKQAREIHWDADEPLAESDRCLSPSDYGFHNSLIDEKGRLRFIDFEYAGWDDPAKLVCDFFCEPAVPVAQDHFQSFSSAAAASFKDAARLRQRIALLMPLHRIKWCCILLNDYLQIGKARRRFARHSHLGQGQLDKARAYLRAGTPVGGHNARS